MTEITKDCEETKFPVDRSMKADNAFYHHCDIHEQQAGYMICLYKIKAVEDDRLSEDNPCYRPITHGSCPALKLRGEEIGSGRALFFIDREGLKLRMEAQSEESMRKLRERPGWAEGKPRAPAQTRPTMQLKTTRGPAPGPQSEPPPEPEAGLVIEGGNLMEKALNRRIKKEMQDNA